MYNTGLLKLELIAVAIDIVLLLLVHISDYSNHNTLMVILLLAMYMVVYSMEMFSDEKVVTVVMHILFAIMVFMDVIRNATELLQEQLYTIRNNDWFHKPLFALIDRDILGNDIW